MAAPITFPRLGWTMDEGTFVRWSKADGESVRVGEPLFEMESEKATETITAIDAGILRIPADGPKPGQVVRVGSVIGFLAAAGEVVRCGEEKLEVRDQKSEVRGQKSEVRSQRSEVQSQKAGRHRISPRARRVATELSVDCRALAGSGQGGRIRERDVRAAAAAEHGRLIPHTQIRKIIAARMVAGVTQAAPVTLTAKADATRLVELRHQSAGDFRPSYTDCFLKLVAIVLRQHPYMQAQWRDDGLYIPTEIHLAFAVDTEAGLLAPVIRDADRLTLAEISRQTRELAMLARHGKLAPASMRDGTFTLSNLGMFGIDAFTPIIHLPQSAVLGVGRIVREPAVVGNGIEPRDFVTLSLTFDHRVVDGAPAARFMAALCQSIEQPVELLK